MATSTGKASIKSFEASVKALLQTAFEVHDKAYGSLSAQQLWMIYANKFFTAFVKAKNPDGFHDMFMRFYTGRSKEIVSPIFIEVDDDTVVNDKWLRDDEIKPGPGIKIPSKTKKASSEDTWSPAESSRCKGYVIYFDDTNPKLVAVSIPISEIYRAAMKLYREKGAKDTSCRTLPARVLLHFYSILHNILPDLDAGKETITTNCVALEDFIGKLTPTDGGNVEGVGAGLQGIGKIMAQVMKAAGMSSTGIDETNITNMLGTALNENAITGMGKVVGEVIKAVQGPGEGKEGGPQGIGDVIGGIGKALQSDAVKNAVTETAAATQKQVADLQATVPTASAAPAGPTLPLPSESFNPAAQE